MEKRRVWKQRSRIWITVVGVILMAGVLGYFGFRQHLVENERAAWKALHDITNAQGRFRGDDCDANGVPDFWTGDVAGLFSLVIEGKELQLIERALAEADAAPLRAAGPLRPFHGYYFAVLEADDSCEDPGEKVYRQDTGGSPSLGKVHHKSRLGICAYPAVPGFTGRYVFIINESNTVYRAPVTASPPKSWPPDMELKKWEKCT